MKVDTTSEEISSIRAEQALSNRRLSFQLLRRHADILCTGEKLCSTGLEQTTCDDDIEFLIFFWCAGSVRYHKVGKVVYALRTLVLALRAGLGGGLALKSFWAPNLKFDQYVIVRV